MAAKLKVILSLLLLLLTSCVLPSNKSPDLVIHEYLLVGPPDISTEMLSFRFANGDQKEILARTATYRDARQQIAEYNNKLLNDFGYRLGDYQGKDYSEAGRYFNIYRGENLIATSVVFMSPLSVNASKTDFLGFVDLWDGNTYIFTREGLEKRIWPPEKEPYAYLGNKVLSVEFASFEHQKSLAKIYLDDNLVYQSEIHNVSTYGSQDGPWVYDGHWAIVLLDAQKDERGDWKLVNRLVQDGQDLNAKYDYEQSFQFAVLGGHPFYFFQKEGKINISFNEQQFTQGYDEIPHYNCCSPALLNPGISMNMIWFFARRGADWYYVEAYVPMEKANSGSIRRKRI